MDTKYAPVYVLREYLWKLLQVNMGWNAADYGGLMPILPAEEEPNISQYDKPYIVYGYNESPTLNNRNFVKRGSMSLAIRSTRFTEIVDVLNTITTAMEREDEAAADVNTYSSTAGFSIPIGIRFTTISIGYLDGPGPEASEGGRQMGIVNIRYDYVVNYDVVTNFAS